MSTRPGFAVLCDESGTITDVLVDRGGHETPLEIGHAVASIVEEDSREKFASFLERVREERAAFDWEMNVRAGGTVHVMRFSGVRVTGGVLVVGVGEAFELADLADEFIQMNSELLNQIRQLRKEAAQRPDASLSRLTVLNNELTNVQRELAKRNAELERAMRFQEAVLDTNPNIVYVYSLEPRRLTYVNGRVEQVLGIPREAVLEGGAIVIHPDDVEARRAASEQVRTVGPGQVVVSEARVRRASGEWCWFRFHETVFARDADGRATEVLGTAQDVSEERALKERLRELALIDDLTGLSNRRGFRVLAEHALSRAERESADVGLIYLDLDGLKAINDVFGHAAGDDALRDVARLLRETMRASDVVARTGGDEFEVLAIGDPALDLDGLAGRLRGAIEAFNATGERAYSLSVSIGAVRCHLDQSRDLAHWAAVADRLMYEEKARKRGR